MSAGAAGTPWITAEQTLMRTNCFPLPGAAYYSSKSRHALARNISCGLDAAGDNMTSSAEMTSSFSAGALSCGDGEIPFGISVAGISLGIGVLTLGVFGNVLVILAIWLYTPLRKASNLFVASLALCDLFHTTLVRPLYVYTYISGKWNFGPHVCAYALISSNLAILESIVHVTAIAFHRYVILVHPRSVVCFQRKIVILGMLVGIYALPLTVVLVQSSVRLRADLKMDDDVIFNRRIMFCSFVRHSEYKLAGVIKKMSFVMAAAFFIFYCYIRIYHLVRTRGKRLGLHGSFSPVRLRRELTILKTVVAVFLMFVVNYLPITLIYGWDTTRSLPYVAYFVSVMLLWTSSGVNWIIYGLMNVQFSRAYCYLLCGATYRNAHRPSTERTSNSRMSQNLLSMREVTNCSQRLNDASRRSLRPTTRLQSLPETKLDF